MNKEIYIVEKNDAPRLDVFLTAETGVTRSYISALNDKGKILLNGQSVKSGKLVRAGDVIQVEFSTEGSEILPENIHLDIIFEDDSIAVINKQQGLTVHPSSGIYTGTLVNALLFHIKDLSGINGIIRPGIVHRLDKNTSGVMVTAKSDEAHLNLSEQIARREMVKIYLAVLEGNLKEDSGTIETMIARDSRDRKKMAVVTGGGRNAITFYKVLERYKNNCLVEFNIKTGRTHQIRVHAKYLNHPIVGDEVYGHTKQRFALNGQLLHSSSLTLTHPKTAQVMTFNAPLPDYYEKILIILRNETKE